MRQCTALPFPLPEGRPSRAVAELSEETAAPEAPAAAAVTAAALNRIASSDCLLRIRSSMEAVLRVHHPAPTRLPGGPSSSV